MSSSKKTLRERVSTYFRQLSFINEPRIETRIRNRSGNCFIRKYLEGGYDEDPTSPPIYSGGAPEDLPNVPLGHCCSNKDQVIACTGPEKGILSVVRPKLHLSAGSSDIDFIDNNNQDEGDFEIRRSKRANAQRFGGIVAKSGAQTQQCISEDKENANDGAALELSANQVLAQQSNENVAGIMNWSGDSDFACGLATSLYERNPITKEVTGSPIADCFAIISYGDGCVMGMADGVNWGEKASLAARAALQGSIEYLEGAIFGTVGVTVNRSMTTHDVFVSLLRSIWEGHNCIVEVGGALTTLSIAVVLPAGRTKLADAGDEEIKEPKKWIVCACNVGDSLGYVYSKTHGVREFTQASHDTTTMRDMRDALGALGMVHGTKPELGNLTLSMTTVSEGDIVFLTSDGVSDNFDPVVGKFAEAYVEDSSNEVLKTSTQNKSTAPVAPPRKGRPQQSQLPANQRATKLATDDKLSLTRPQYSRSRTLIEPRTNIRSSIIPGTPPVQRISSILPQVTGAQRHKLTLLRLEDLLSYGINGMLQPCESSRRLCQLLLDFSKMITAARRAMLEQRETYTRLCMDTRGSRKETELNRMQQRAARKRVVDSLPFQALPGKLDHASVVAFTCRHDQQHSNEAVLLCKIEKPDNPKKSSIIETDL